jgi:hypothetical protein
MSASAVHTTPLQASSSQGVKLDVDGIIMQLLAAKDTPGKQVMTINKLSCSFGTGATRE